MVKKAQAAMEFLMTYGWAILVVLVVIGALVYFIGPNIVNSMIPEKCISGDAGLSCKAALITNDGFVKLKLQNNYQETVTISKLAGSDNTISCATGDISTNIAPGSSGDILLSCGGIPSIGKKKLALTTTFYKQSESSAFAHPAKGELVTTASSAAGATTGLVGYWKFEEGGGTVAKDNSGYGNDGTLKNRGYTCGDFGSELLLNSGGQGQADWNDVNSDGVADYWNVPAGTGTILTSGSNGFSGRVQRLDSAGGSSRIWDPNEAVMLKGRSYSASFKYRASKSFDVCIRDWSCQTVSANIGNAISTTVAWKPADGSYQYRNNEGILFRLDGISGTDWLEIDEVSIKEVCPSWVAGKHGSALSFDGVDDYADCGIGSSLQITNAITVEAWAYPTSQKYQNIIKKLANYHLHLRPTAFVPVIYIDGVGGISPVVYTISDYRNRWQHFAFTYDKDGGANNFKAYYNGALVGQATLTGALTNTPTNSVEIGKAHTSEWFNGPIDEVRIYNRAITPAEIKAIYDAEK